MESNAGIAISKKTILITNFKKSKDRKCKECGALIQLSKTYRVCMQCQQKKQREKMKTKLFTSSMHQNKNGITKLMEKKLKLKVKKIRSKERKANSPSKLKKKLDTLISLYVRKRAADGLGNAQCVSCKKYYGWEEMQNGHYVSRANYSLRYDLRNCHPQCLRCNIFLKGNYPAYTNYLLENYGVAWLKTLIKDGEKIRKWTVPELQAKIAFYTEALKKL